MLIALLWLITIGLSVVGLVISFPQTTLQLITQLKRYFHQRYARRYGQATADHHFPLHPWEAVPWKQVSSEPKPGLSLADLYVAGHGYFFRYLLGLARPIPNLNLNKRKALRLFIVGFLIRWGLAEIKPGRE